MENADTVAQPESNDGNKNSLAPDDGRMPPIHRRREMLRECEALLVYVARHGDVMTKDNNLQADVENLAKLIASEQSSALTPENWSKLVVAYAKVTQTTYAARGVNGRSVLDTWGDTDKLFRETGSVMEEQREKSGKISRILKWFRSSRRRRRPMRVAISLFLLALVLQWLTSLTYPTDPFGQHVWGLFWIETFSTHISPLLIPAAWGGIGSCVFLMKRISDKLFELAFEETRLKGDGARIVLGAIMGVAVVQIFFPEYSSTITAGNVTFGPTTAALIAGLGVKPIYAAFEAVAEGIAGRLSSPNKG